MTATDQQRLGKTLWAIADQLRGAMSDFPDATKMVPLVPIHSRATDHFRGVTKMIRRCPIPRRCSPC